MAKSVITSLLVIGENHKEIANKYSLDREVEPYVRYKRDDAEKLRKQHLKFIDTLLTTDKVKFTVNQKEAYKDLYQDINDMDDFDYYLYISEGCTYDMDTMDAISKENPLAEYRGERCYDNRFKDSGLEANMVTPFTLKDGTRAYVAKKGDIDWSIMHLREENIRMYACAWDVVMNYPTFNSEDISKETIKTMMSKNPDFKTEEDVINTLSTIHKNNWIAECAKKYNFDNSFVFNIFNNMCGRQSYFECFKDVDEYVKHSSSFWTYGVATADKYYSVNHKISDKAWTTEFYKTFIEPLSDDTVLALYEVRSLDN